jgi:hypothetical protein
MYDLQPQQQPQGSAHVQTLKPRVCARQLPGSRGGWAQLHRTWLPGAR